MKWQRVVIAIALLALLTGTSYFVIKKVAPSITEQVRLSGLLPNVKDKLEALRDDLRTNHNLETFVGSTRRTQSEQDKNVSRGVSATSHSWHLLGRAVDLYPIIEATGKPDKIGSHLELFQKMHDVAKGYGFHGLAFNPDGTKRYITTNKGKVWDGGHLEYTDGMTWAQAAKQQGFIA